MTHPDPDVNEYQNNFLSSCAADKKRMHELMFKVGNATYRYHQQAKKFPMTEEIWKQWIEGLQEPVKSGMQAKGFEECKTVLAFTRYVNELNDLGLDQYLRDNIDPKDLEEYEAILNS